MFVCITLPYLLEEKRSLSWAIIGRFYSILISFCSVRFRRSSNRLLSGLARGSFSLFSLAFSPEPVFALTKNYLSCNVRIQQLIRPNKEADLMQWLSLKIRHKCVLASEPFLTVDDRVFHPPSPTTTTTIDGWLAQTSSDATNTHIKQKYTHFHWGDTHYIT